ncbi:hypothetical protein MUP05_00130 [Candidatus Bathyarchaeota archaeon]|nr:hypothetical protein [Candidatus Bathyarchaeota archaeon]
MKRNEVTTMNLATAAVLFLAGGLIAWALWMIWEIHRGRQKGCVSCNLSESRLAHPPNSLVCKTCGGFQVDPARGMKTNDASVQ